MTSKAVRLRWSTAIAAAAISSACGGPQSALTPAGRDAEIVADLFWAMAAGALLIWIAVIGLAAYIIFFRKAVYSRRGANALIFGGGVALPTVVLAALLVYSLSVLPNVLALPPSGGLTISVSGEQWWWRVRYLLPDGAAIELANEIRLPVGERIELRLESPDVIHSFWVPSLAGKVDMIPGRINRLALEPTRTGTFRGACAEYCGASHAFMSFDVIVLEGIMEPIATGLDQAAMREAVLYYSGLGARRAGPLGPATEAAGSTKQDARGTEIAERGIPAKKVPSCSDCHGPTKTDRNPAYPELAGQFPEYLVLQLQLFARRERGGSEYAHLMPPVAAALTTQEMLSVAQYYASLPR